MSLVLQRNWQRPGVATQAMLDEFRVLLDEFRALQKRIEGGETVMVM